MTVKENWEAYGELVVRLYTVVLFQGAVSKALFFVPALPYRVLQLVHRIPLQQSSNNHFTVTHHVVLQLLHCILLQQFSKNHFTVTPHVNVDVDVLEYTRLGKFNHEGRFLTCGDDDDESCFSSFSSLSSYSVFSSGPSHRRWMEEEDQKKSWWMWFPFSFGATL